MAGGGGGKEGVGRQTRPDVSWNAGSNASALK